MKALAAVDLNLLVVLHALLAERNVTRAATRVALSQSATSHALARLRAVYGDPLLVRKGRRLELTPRALDLLPQVERGLRELEGTLHGEPPFDAATAERHFTINMADYAHAVLLPPLLRRLRRDAPRFDLTALALPNGLEALDAGTADLAVLSAKTGPPGYTSRRLFSDGFLCMIRRQHPVLRGPHARLTLARFASLDHLLVAPVGGPGSVVDTELERRGLTRRVAVRISSFLAAPLLVAESDLISTGPARLLRAMVERYPIRVFTPPLPLPSFEIQLVWHPRRDHDPAHIWLRQAVVDAVDPGPAGLST